MSCKFLCDCKGTAFFRYMQIFYKDFAIYHKIHIDFAITFAFLATLITF